MSTRAKEFDALEDVNRDLLLRIYGSRENFIESPYRNPIDKYIIAFDQHMGDPDVLIVYNLSIRLGAKAVPSDENINVYMYNLFNVYLDYELGTPVTGLPRLSEMINMNKQDYYRYAKDNLQLQNLDQDFGRYYDQRLRHLLQAYRAS